MRARLLLLTVASLALLLGPMIFQPVRIHASGIHAQQANSGAGRLEAVENVDRDLSALTEEEHLRLQQGEWVAVDPVWYPRFTWAWERWSTPRVFSMSVLYRHHINWSIFAAVLGAAIALVSAMWVWFFAARRRRIAAESL